MRGVPRAPTHQGGIRVVVSDTQQLPFHYPNNVLLHLGDLPAKRGGRFTFALKDVRDLFCALVSQVEIAFWDKEEVEKSPERTIQTCEFPTLAPGVPVVVENAECARCLLSSARRERRVTVI
jgi:hypothetical protein